MNVFQKVLSALLALALAGCAQQYATVSHIRPIFRPVGSTVAALVAVDQCIAKAVKREKDQPIEALGEYLTAAQIASEQLARNPSDMAAREACNFAVARVLGTVQNARLDPWSQPLRVPAPGGDFVLTRKPDPRPQWNPALYDFTPADEFDVTGRYVAKHEIKEGLGAPTVAVGRDKNENAAQDFTMAEIYRTIATADLPFATLKQRALIDSAARAANDAPDFSRRIREGRSGF